MLDKIAVTVNAIKHFTALGETTIILLYQKQDDTWQLRKEIPVQFNFKSNLEDLRNQIRNLITKLEDCKIILSPSINGLPFHIFDRMGFHIFEMTDFTPQDFDEIVADVYRSEHENSEQSDTALGPVKTVDGIYFLDLIQLQTTHPDISSKRALQPFLKNTPFIKLDFICSHLPPWLDTIEFKSQYDITTKKNRDTCLVTVSHKICLQKNKA